MPLPTPPSSSITEPSWSFYNNNKV
jgi:hypothetical protein